jgi:hypothetical protein
MRQRLTDAVHLVVMPALGECKELSLELREPWGLAGEEHLTARKLGGFDRHPSQFVSLQSFAARPHCSDCPLVRWPPNSGGLFS